MDFSNMILLQVAGRHLPLFEAYYKELDPKNTNTIGALAAAKFLKNSGLSDVLLSKVRFHRV